MKTSAKRDLHQILIGLAMIAAALALAFFPVYTIELPLTAFRLALDVFLISAAGTLLAVGCENIFNEFDKPES
jgi:hypothetical protein